MCGYPMYMTAHLASGLLSFLQSLHFCLRTPHPSSVSSCSPFTAIFLGQILPKFTHLVSNWTRFYAILFNKCSISGKGETNRCMLAFFLINLTSSLWEEKIIERRKKEKQINEMLRTKLPWEWEGGGGGRLLTVGSHICIKRPDTSGVISQHTETKNNNCSKRDGPNERRGFALHNKAEHFQRCVSF